METVDLEQKTKPIFHFFSALCRKAMVKNQIGSALIWAILGLSLLLGGAVGVYYGSQESAPSKYSAKDRFQNLVQELDKALANQEVLQWSVGRNENSFSCLSSVSGNCRGAGGKFLLYGGAESAAAPLSQLSKGMGLTAEGESCKSFPSENCPLRVEAAWQPICSNAYCEKTNQAKVFVRALMYEPGKNLEKWEKNTQFYPQILLSAATKCAREANVWTGVDCISAEQARNLASGGKAALVPQENLESAGVLRSRNEGAPAMAEPEKEVICPSIMPIQGENFPVQMISVNRGRVVTPAMNGCAAEDIFIFQCQPNQDDDREGQWIQVEAQMAPNCEGNFNNTGSISQPMQPAGLLRSGGGRNRF